VNILKVSSKCVKNRSPESEGYRVLVLDGSRADAAVSLPESHGVIITSSGENHRITAHGALIHIHDELNPDLTTTSQENDSF